MCLLTGLVLFPRYFFFVFHFQNCLYCSFYLGYLWFFFSVECLVVSQILGLLLFPSSVFVLFQSPILLRVIWVFLGGDGVGDGSPSNTTDPPEECGRSPADSRCWRWWGRWRRRGGWLLLPPLSHCNNVLQWRNGSWGRRRRWRQEVHSPQVLFSS